MMTQPTPTPIPDHGTGWGLLVLFLNLYGIVALLGVGTIVVLTMNQFDRQIPKILHYLLVAVLLVSLVLSGFITLVAGTAQRYDVVALLLLIVFLPLTLSVLYWRGRVRDWVVILTHAAIAWSLPFLVGFGVIAFIGTRTRGISPEIAAVLAVIIVVTGTLLIERLPFFPDSKVSKE